MTTYLALLRGINVSGKNRLKMKELRNALTELPYLRTYIQSGNLVFSYPEKDNKMLERMISEKILQSFGFGIPILVLKKSELLDIIKNNPLKSDPTLNEQFIGVTFLFEQPAAGPFKEIENKKQASEKIHFTPNAIYMYCPDGFARTKLTNTFIEKKLNVFATTRNWRTVNKLKDMMKGLD